MHYIYAAHVCLHVRRLCLSARSLSGSVGEEAEGSNASFSFGVRRSISHHQGETLLSFVVRPHWSDFPTTVTLYSSGWILIFQLLYGNILGVSRQ